jgi:hypothetical protein
LFAVRAPEMCLRWTTFVRMPCLHQFIKMPVQICSVIATKAAKYDKL